MIIIVIVLFVFYEHQSYHTSAALSACEYTVLRMENTFSFRHALQILLSHFLCILLDELFLFFQFAILVLSYDLFLLASKSYAKHLVTLHIYLCYFHLTSRMKTCQLMSPFHLNLHKKLYFLSLPSALVLHLFSHIIFPRSLSL